MTDFEPRTTGPAPAELHTGFREFVAAARRLERSHASLKARAERVDRELAETNARLRATLDEREGLLAALPVGVVRVLGGALAPRDAVRPANEAGVAMLEGASDADLAGILAGTGTRDATVGGERRPLRIQESRLEDGGRLLVVEDRSRVEGLEREVARLDRLAGLSELALGIAHEIKNPLHGVMGFADLLGRAAEDDVPKAKRHAARIREGLARVDAIVRALLAFARPTDGRAPAPSPVREVVEQAAAGAGMPAERIALRDRSGGAQAESGPLVRVLANLFRNAAEAAAPDPVRITVFAVLRREDERDLLEIVVEDDGPGIPEQLGERVFEPFVSTKDGGHGLGLPLAARVLAYLGGSLRLERPGPRGARFVLALPVVGGDPVADAVEVDA